MSAESIDIPLKDVPGVWSTKCVYLELLCLLSLLLGLKFVVYSDVSMFMSLQNEFGLNGVPSLAVHSQGLHSCNNCFWGWWACGCMSGSAGFDCVQGWWEWTFTPSTSDKRETLFGWILCRSKSWRQQVHWTKYRGIRTTDTLDWTWAYSIIRIPCSTLQTSDVRSAPSLCVQTSDILKYCNGFTKHGFTLYLVYSSSKPNGNYK